MKTYHYRVIKGSIWGDVHGNGGITVVVEKCDDGVLVGYSICSMHDRFCKKTGREIAEERLKHSPCYVNLCGVPSRDTMLSLLHEGLIRQTNNIPFPMQGEWKDHVVV